MLGLTLIVVHPGDGLAQQPGNRPAATDPANGRAGEVKSNIKPPNDSQPASSSQTSPTSEKALSIYADAANFQNNGELALAIEQWEAFLASYPEDVLAPKAAHYLGVCLMQLAEPNYAGAKDAFQRALRDPKSDLREESLANLGWCSYALGSDPNQADQESLRQAITTYTTLLRENPGSRFADRAHFYIGEAEFSLGNMVRAIASYDRLLKSRLGETSALRCSALYAKGIAQEELEQYDAAAESYRTMLARCGEHPLAIPVRLQLAEVLVMQEKYAEAEPLFAAVIQANGTEKPRALARRAFVLAQLERADEAAALYEQIIREYPDSPFAASALLAAAQSFYRAGDYEQAAERFQEVVTKQADRAAATEASHWLSVLAMREGNFEEAYQWAREQIERGLEGTYALPLRLDAAEALSMQPEGLDEALQQFEALLGQANAEESLLPRILYNAAFSAFQLGQAAKTIAFAKQFDETFPGDILATDVLYLAAEAHMQAGDTGASLAAFDRLLSQAPSDHPQRPNWLLRSAAVLLNDGKAADVVARLTPQMQSLQATNQKAEAYFLIGTAQFSQENFAAAIAAFETGLSTASEWNQKDQLLFRLGAAHSSAGDSSAASRAWKRLINDLPDSALVPQAQYRLAQEASAQTRYDDALQYYDDILKNPNAANLIPFARYGKGWALLQQEAYEDSAVELTKFLDQFTEHPLRDDALLARGICHRRLEKSDLAQNDLEAFLALTPSGEELGNALLELAFIAREKRDPQGAINRLQQIVREAPDYGAMPNVLYELAWNLMEQDKEEEANQVFMDLGAKFPTTREAAEANYQVGQFFYNRKEWNRAEVAYRHVIDGSFQEKHDFREKALYRLGWTLFQKKDFEGSNMAFAKQADEFPEGELSIDALMMVGETRFSQNNYAEALKAYQNARKTIERRDGEAKKFTNPEEQQVRELVYLHGGQSAAQLKQWETAIEWYDSLRKRYVSSSYLPQVFYETGFAYQQLDRNEEALKFYTETANNFRDEAAARARFMMGEIFFEQNQPAEAIVEFKRVMYGFGAEKAARPIQDWQAKSGFEAGRCAELLIQANQGEKRREAIELAIKYYEYVTENHKKHELAAKAKDRLEALKRM